MSAQLLSRLLQRGSRFQRHYLSIVRTTSTTDTQACCLSTSSTAIHAPTPASFSRSVSKQTLQKSLQELSHLNFGNQSRIQLALRCLEQDNVPIRVAVLGTFTDHEGFRRESTGDPTKFLRVLLANPLSPSESWEEELINWSGWEETQGLLLRYSPNHIPLTADQNSPVSILSIPSAFLQQHNVEILLSSLPPKKPSPEDVYVPTLVAPLPTSNYSKAVGPQRTTGMVMRYPVHKSILFSDGLEELLMTAGVHSRINETGDGTNESVLSVAMLPGMDYNIVKAKLRGRIKLLDLEAAEEALGLVRENLSNAVKYQKEFIRSGVDEVKEWLIAHSSGHGATIPTIHPATKALISSILASVSLQLESGAHFPPGVSSPIVEDTSRRIPSTPPQNTDTVQTLSQAMQLLSADAHNELKTSLDEAFTSDYWTNKLAWYKLYYNLEDIPYLISMTIQHRFLPETEKEGWILAGRMWGAGFRNFSGKPRKTITAQEIETATPAELEISKIITAANPGTATATTAAVKEHATPMLDKPFLPSYISLGLNQVMEDLIPQLHSAATKHVLRSTSIGLSSALTTVLLYLSEVPLYTSFSATVLGGFIALKYLQKRWKKDKKRFEGDVREVGRNSIVHLERWGWNVLRAEVEEKAIASKIVAEEDVPIGSGWIEKQRLGRARNAVDQGLKGLRSL